MGLTFICFLFVSCVGASEVQAPPGLAAGLFGNLVGMSDFQLNLHPPEEHAQDVQEALDALLKVERIKMASENDDFAMAKQRLLNDEKDRIRDMVHAAFEPLRAKLPGRMQAMKNKVVSP